MLSSCEPKSCTFKYNVSTGIGQTFPFQKGEIGEKEKVIGSRQVPNPRGQIPLDGKALWLDILPCRSAGMDVSPLESVCLQTHWREAHGGRITPQFCWSWIGPLRLLGSWPPSSVPRVLLLWLYHQRSRPDDLWIAISVILLLKSYLACKGKQPQRFQGAGAPLINGFLNVLM